jgi:lysophospholipid acyltransferase (LPLAT)-like uncharacterized protein
MLEAARRGAIPSLARWAVEGLLATARFQVVRAPAEVIAPARQPVIFVLWHGRLLPLAYLHRGQGIATLISRSADGEYIARVMERWGYVTARGSSSRGGGPALRELVRAARAGHSVAITPDGPRGPRERLKPGALMAARLSGLPLVPAAAGADRAWWPGAWDRFLVPKPFAHIRVAYGDAIPVPRDADQPSLERIAGELQSSLDTIMRAVDGR